MDWKKWKRKTKSKRMSCRERMKGGGFGREQVTSLKLKEQRKILFACMNLIFYVWRIRVSVAVVIGVVLLFHLFSPIILGVSQVFSYPIPCSHFCGILSDYQITLREFHPHRFDWNRRNSIYSMKITSLRLSVPFQCCFFVKYKKKSASWPSNPKVSNLSTLHCMWSTATAAATVAAMVIRIPTTKINVQWFQFYNLVIDVYIKRNCYVNKRL